MAASVVSKAGSERDEKSKHQKGQEFYRLFKSLAKMVTAKPILACRIVMLLPNVQALVLVRGDCMYIPGVYVYLCWQQLLEVPECVMV